MVTKLLCIKSLRNLNHDKSSMLMRSHMKDPVSLNMILENKITHKLFLRIKKIINYSQIMSVNGK